ncbi:MAG: GumC family protein [Myxococcota bacterium]
MNQSSLSPLSSRLQLTDVLPVLRRNLPIMIGCVVIAVVLAAVATAFVSRKYTASALMQITPSVTREVNRRDAMDIDIRGYREVERFYRTQIQLLESRSMLTEILRQYHEMGYSDIPLDESGAGQLKAMLEAAHEDRSQLLAVIVTHTDPERAAVLANLAATTFERKNLDQRREAASGANSWLKDTIVEVKERHSTAVRELFAFIAENDLGDIDETTTEIATKSEVLQMSAAELNREIVLLEARISQHKAQMAKREWMVLAGMLDEPVLNSLVGSLADARAECATLSATKGAKHPMMERCTQTLDQLSEEVRAEIRTTIESEKAELRALRQQNADVRTATGATREDMLARLTLKSEYLELKRNVEQAEETHKTLLKRSAELDLSARTQLNNIRVVDLALVPKTHTWPNLYLNLAAGLVLGLMGGVILSLARAFVDDTIRSPEDVTTYLGLPVLGVLPRFSKNEEHQREIIAHHSRRSIHAEAMRGVRAMIDLRPNADPPRRVLVTSAIESEGKTSVACRLGVAIAQQGQRVILVEADHRKARLHKVFGLKNVRGITEYLLDSAPLESCIQATEVPGLFVMPLGARRPGTTELLAAGHIDKLLAELEENFDRIVFDTAPSAALTEGVALSRAVDGVVLVVRAGVAGRTVVRHTLERYRAVGAELLGIVLNDATEEGWLLGRYGYGYRSSYYYYSNADSENETPDADNKPSEVAK